MNQLDRHVEDYPVQTLTITFLTQRVVHMIGHCRLLRTRSRLLMLQYSLHKRFESASSQFISRDCPLTV
jgi:hypothetical protein